MLEGGAGPGIFLKLIFIRVLVSAVWQSESGIRISPLL